MKPVALALLLACLAPVAARAESWPFDAARSQAQFSVRKFWLAHERGTFANLHGTLRRIDTRNGADLAEVDADIRVADLTMDDAGAVRHALGDGFFDVAQYPEIRFDSDPFPFDQLVRGGPLRGMLSLHGVSQPVSFTLLPTDCPRQPLLCVIRVRGALSRSRFGMHAWRGVVGDKVELSMRILLHVAPASQP